VRARPVPPGRSSRPAAGRPGVAAPQPRGATPAAQRPWRPNSAPAAQATAAPGRTADRAVEEPCADHRGPATPLANSQLSAYDRISGTHRNLICALFGSAEQGRNRGSLQPDQVGQHHDALLIEDLVVEEAMSAGKREDYCLVLCATYDGECRARGRGIGAQERDDPGNIPLELRRGIAELLADSKTNDDPIPGGQARPRLLPRGPCGTHRRGEPVPVARGSPPPALATWAAG